MRRLLAVTTCALALAAACGRTEVVRYVDEPEAPDAGHDAGRPDAGRPDAGRPDAGQPDAACPPFEAPIRPAVPTVMFVIDRSGSMADNLNGTSDGGTSRWEVLETSLRNILPPLDQRLAMGALMYPVNGSSCSLPFSVDLSPAVGNTTRLLALFNTRPLGGTPTFEAVRVAAAHLLTLRTASAARALVLTTDGAPNCNPASDPRTCTCTRPPTNNVCQPQSNCLDDTRTIDGLRTLFQDSNLPTYVVGLGSQLSLFAGTLNQMALAGGVPRTDAGTSYYSAESEAELTDAFSRITSQLTRCTYLVDGVGPADTFTVFIDGVEVPEGADGWQWLNLANGELGLSGRACDAVANGGTPSVLVDCR